MTTKHKNSIEISFILIVYFGSTGAKLELNTPKKIKSKPGRIFMLDNAQILTTDALLNIFSQFRQSFQSCMCGCIMEMFAPKKIYSI